MIHTTVNKSIGKRFHCWFINNDKGDQQNGKVIKLMLGVVGATSVGLFKGESVVCADDSASHKSEKGI